MSTITHYCDVHYYNMPDGHCTCPKKCKHCEVEYLGYDHSPKACIDILVLKLESVRAQRSLMVQQLIHAVNDKEEARWPKLIEIVKKLSDNQKIHLVSDCKPDTNGWVWVFVRGVGWKVGKYTPIFEKPWYITEGDYHLTTEEVFAWVFIKIPDWPTERRSSIGKEG